uniref:CBS domain-containing protein n=1 Tax=Pseudo-nitzschia australis TaxID=44445 RepID=A0A7S4A925_9STRA|mmetsp:Transcript_13493/g.28287  ORF Transcript_13493/g.28287 Transcript_13493/m.28287 type:complete len:201 (+) Transcript_13493:206-808(+)|eukprot:CAMPEP_0168184824 /NCGR_PEP_ID=MMETSP0139_2-20121125/13470_1 /TAXON_ID=44445 /ORGANISM="Pseudo-nitzschia australis, Strain 10249 10 AB" /LENGTH=200 /DNA_ID=CAMNT_0008106521 /DNA_START=177 /DNA_END=779 /DNA_ORIENTATION=-
MKYLQFAVSVLCIASGNAFSTPARVFVGTPKKTNPRLVRDCMSLNPKTLKTTDTVDEAIVALLSLGFNGAPVVDPITNALVGCVSAFDFIQKEETGALLPFDMEDPEKQKEMTINARKIVGTTVGELATEPALTIHMDTNMKDAAETLTKTQRHRLCVVDDGNNLVGILSTSDVMRNIVDVLKALPEASSVDMSVGKLAP